MQNGPAFRQSTAEFSIPENNQVGDLVGSLEWYDADVHEANRRGARVELVTRPGEAEREPFEVRFDPTTRAVELRALERFDRETRDLYDVRVRIYDPALTKNTTSSDATSGQQQQAGIITGGIASQPESSASANSGSEIRVVVRIADVNDNAPRLIVHNLTIPEGPVNSGTMLLRLNGTDADAAGTSNTRLTYGFLDAEGRPIIHGSVRSFNPNRSSGSSSKFSAAVGEQSSGSVQFSMQPSGSGKIFLDTDRLDRELEDTHCVRVFVQDQGDYPIGPLSSNATLCVFVSDVNDEAPTFIFPNDLNNSLNVSLEKFLSGEGDVGRVQSVDRDKGPGGEVVYSLLQNCGDECSCCTEFAIDPTSGQLSLRRKSHLSSASPMVASGAGGSSSNPKPITLIVQATDRGAEPLSTPTTLLVYLVPSEAKVAKIVRSAMFISYYS